jgi:hypothetical protein
MNVWQGSLKEQQSGGWVGPAVSAGVGVIAALLILAGISGHAARSGRSGGGAASVEQATAPPAPTAVAARVVWAPPSAPKVIYLVNTEEETAIAWELHRDLYTAGGQAPVAEVFVAPLGAGSVGADWIPDTAEHLGLWLIVVDLRVPQKEEEATAMTSPNLQPLSPIP